MGGAGLHQQRMEQCDLPSTLMTPSRCSILMAPQHNRMMTMVCKLLSRCSLSIPTTFLMPLNLGDFELWNNLSLNVPTSFSASLSSSWCPEALSPFYILLYSQISTHSVSAHSVQLSGALSTVYSDLCSILLAPPN